MGFRQVHSIQRKVTVEIEDPHLIGATTTQFSARTLTAAELAVQPPAECIVEVALCTQTEAALGSAPRALGLQPRLSAIHLWRPSSHKQNLIAGKWRQRGDMETSRPVIVKRVPESLNLKQARAFLEEVRPLLEHDRPQLVFDLSLVRKIDAAGVDMLLYCMKEAARRDGDLKLASLSPQAQVVLDLTRTGRLFETFATPPMRCAASADISRIWFGSSIPSLIGWKWQREEGCVSVREQALGSWPQSRMRTAFETLKASGSEGKVFTGGVVMLAGSVLVSLANFGYNIGVAHLLGPGDFSQAAAAVTLLMLASCINLAYQLVTAKLIAKTTCSGRARRGLPVPHAPRLAGRLWPLGRLCWSQPLDRRLPANAFADPRRAARPRDAFLHPAGSAARRNAGHLPVSPPEPEPRRRSLCKADRGDDPCARGAGVLGAVGAISLSVFAAFLLPAGDRELRQTPARYQPGSFLEGIQAIIFFIGQVIISNVDILMVKHYFAPADAGIYAAVALVGRLLYFATWSVTSAMFPISAGSAAESDSRRVLVVPLLFVAGLSTVFVVFLASFPGLVIRTLFGSDFHRAGAGVEQLLAMNAVATAVYAVCVVLITYEMSRRIANTGWLQLVVSLLIVLCCLRLSCLADAGHCGSAGAPRPAVDGGFDSIFSPCPESGQGGSMKKLRRVHRGRSHCRIPEERVLSGRVSRRPREL